MAGPLISSALFAVLGYKMMFFVYGGAEIILAIIIRLCISDAPAEGEKPDEEGEKARQSRSILLRATQGSGARSSIAG